MRLSDVCMLSVSVLTTGAVLAFMPAATFVTPKQHFQAPSSSSLHISLTNGVDLDDPIKEVYDPRENIQAYLSRPENGTRPRANLKGNCIVSGLLKNDDVYREDQTVFDLLNDEESKFNFDKIIAHCTDTAYARKRMVSRKARYTGLLDALEFAEEDSPIPSAELLSTCTSWVAYVDSDHVETANAIAKLYKETPSLENVVVMLVEGVKLPNTTLGSVWATFNETGKDGFSLVAVGELTDTPEGETKYGFYDFGLSNKYARIRLNGGGYLDFDTTDHFFLSRALSYRIMTDMLQLKLGEGKALNFVQLTDPEYKKRQLQSWLLIDGLRAGGFTRSEELEHLLDDGVLNYSIALIEYYESPYYKYRGTNYGNNWWEHPYYADSPMSRKDKEDEIRAIVMQWRKNNETIKEIAKEWGQREYYRLAVSGEIDRGIAENVYIEQHWDECMEVAKKRFVELFGEDGTRDIEEEKYQAMLEQKERAAEKRAEKSLDKIIAELESEFPEAYAAE